MKANSYNYQITYILVVLVIIAIFLAQSCLFTFDDFVSIINKFNISLLKPYIDVIEIVDIDDINCNERIDVIGENQNEIFSICLKRGNRNYFDMIRDNKIKCLNETIQNCIEIDKFHQKIDLNITNYPNVINRLSNDEHISMISDYLITDIYKKNDSIKFGEHFKTFELINKNKISTDLKDEYQILIYPGIKNSCIDNGMIHKGSLIKLEANLMKEQSHLQKNLYLHITLALLIIAFCFKKYIAKDFHKLLILVCIIILQICCLISSISLYIKNYFMESIINYIIEEKCLINSYNRDFQHLSEYVSFVAKQNCYLILLNFSSLIVLTYELKILLIQYRLTSNKNEQDLLISKTSLESN